MAAISSTQTTATYANPASDYDHDDRWDDAHRENYNDFNFELNGDSGADNPRSHHGANYATGAQMATRRMKSADNLSGDKYDKPGGDSALLPAYDPEGKNGRATPADFKRPQQNGDNDGSDPEVENSKWIHRDKLAKIENEELQAAGIFVPRSRAPSKQRRERSRSAMRRGTDASDQHSYHSRSRKNSAAVADITVPAWDLRTPEEIAEEEANAYFTVNGLGGTRIPVAKTSPAPISLNSFERGSASRKHSESPEEEPLAMTKTRSRSASASLRMGEKPNPEGTLPAAKRSMTDISPKKNHPGNRKVSSAPKSSSAVARPKTRSGSGTGTRPSTRSGESPPAKHPEGDPPWMANSYQPDPRLPPDQQLLPTVARRLQQEKWEKEGTFGDTYDKDFRPLNDKNAFLRPPEATQPTLVDENQESAPTGGEWPLKQETAPKSPSLRQGSYSTMPKISDKIATSPMASPRAPNTPQMMQPQTHAVSQVPERVPDEKEDEKKAGGCGCCIVM